MNTIRTLLFFLFLLFQSNVIAQAKIYVYHTPSGTRYHTAACHMVDNTSNSILLAEALKQEMKPCTFCKPDENKNSLVPQATTPTLKPGQKEHASQCRGITQKQFQCTRQTKNANGYCFQHLPPGKT